MLQNDVLASGGTGSIERALAERALSARLDAYAGEARRLIDAAFAVMRRAGTIDPPVRDVVRAAGLSNQAFYRHFASKDALLLAALADGRRRLVEYLRHRLEPLDDPRAAVRAWIEGVMAQARDRDAAEATRPFALNGARLAERFPEEAAASRAELLGTLRPTVLAAGGSERDVEIVAGLAIDRMHDALVRRRIPDAGEVDHVVAFCLRGLGAGP